MSYSDQQRAVVEALGLSPEELRGLAAALESGQRVVSVREVAATHLATLPRHHRYAKSLNRVILWAGDDNAAAVRAADVTGWALRGGAPKHEPTLRPAMVSVRKKQWYWPPVPPSLAQSTAASFATTRLVKLRSRTVRRRVEARSAPTNSSKPTSPFSLTHVIPNSTTSSSGSSERRAAEGTEPSD